MIAAFSTSSRVCSVALFNPHGLCLGSLDRDEPFAAGHATLDMLDHLLQRESVGRKDLTGFLADLGPGSFTGTRIGVVLAKTLGALACVHTGGIGSHRLIHPSATVVFPSKRGEWFIFRGDEPERSLTLPDEPFVGFGPSVEPSVYPHAERFADVWSEIQWTDPIHLLPRYCIDPSISTPNKPFPEARSV